LRDLQVNRMNVNAIIVVPDVRARAAVSRINAKESNDLARHSGRRKTPDAPIVIASKPHYKRQFVAIGLKNPRTRQVCRPHQLK
jgi:predicted fused transcriptional regulator/phosphomethylpyrimidine kinase